MSRKSVIATKLGPFLGLARPLWEKERGHKKDSPGGSRAPELALNRGLMLWASRSVLFAARSIKKIPSKGELALYLRRGTRRRALASGRFFAAPDTIRQIVEKQIPKGDVLALAEVAGILGAKGTATLLPLCHPLPLHSVRVWSEPSEDSILVFCEAITTGKTGVEMEALTGVSLALLCIYDLTKVIDPVLRIGEVQLEVKEGGKSGLWKNPRPVARNSPMPAVPEGALTGVKVCLLTVSDRCSRGESEDVSGANLRSWCADRGALVVESSVVPDHVESIVKVLEGWLERDKPDLIVTSGGTGVSPRDLTPEAYQLLATRLQGKEIPGIGELLRQSGSR